MTESFFVEAIVFRRVSGLLSWVRNWVVKQKDSANLDFDGFGGVIYGKPYSQATPRLYLTAASLVSCIVAG